MGLKIKILLVIFSFLGIGTAFSQKISVTGWISINAYPLENVNISLGNNSPIAKTDSKGYFEINIPNQPVTLQFSHVSCQTRNIKLTKNRMQKQVEKGILLLGHIEMELKTEQLETVEVTAFRIEKAYNKPEAWILDYELTNGNLVLLLLEDKKRLIRTVDFEGRTLQELPLKHPCKNLFKDCFGNLHALSQDSAFQIEKNQIKYRFALRQFFSLLRPCVVDTYRFLYLGSLSNFNQKIEYTKVCKATSERQPLISVMDEKQAAFNKRFYKEDILGLDKAVNYNPGGLAGIKWRERRENTSNTMKNGSLDISEDEIDALLNTSDDWKKQYFGGVLCRPTYQPLKRINGSLYLFNHLENKVIRFDLDGNQLAEIPTRYAKDDNAWANEIIVNEEETRCFAKFLNTGIVTLKEIDLETGTIKNTCKIEQHIFPEKIRIQNNEVYYLYRDYKKQDRNERRYLWKQRIE